METEYIVWGIPPGEEHENVLYTQAKTMKRAREVCKILETGHGCTKCRVQVLDGSLPDFRNVFN